MRSSWNGILLRSGHLPLSQVPRISLDPKMLQLNTLCEAGRHQCIVMNAMKDVRTKVNIFSIIIMMTIISSGQIDLA